MGPRVSVFLFCRNGARTIRRSVESVLAQTWADFEYVIEDGGSTDGTFEILRSFDDPRMTLRSAPDDGPAGAFWRALRRCRGEYVVACLADETLRPDALAEGVAALDADREAVAITRDAALTTIDGAPTSTVNGRPFDLDGYMAGRFTPNFAAAMFRREALDAVGLHTRRWDLDCGEFELWCRLALHGPIRYVPGVTAHYALHDGQLSRAADNVRRIAEGRLRVIERLGVESRHFDANPAALDACRAATIANFSRHLVTLGAPEAAVELALSTAGDPGRLPASSHPTAAVHECARLARRELDAGRDRLALQVLDTARQFTTAEPALLCDVGINQLAAGFVNDALATFEAAIAADPTLVDAHWHRGVILERRGLIDEALAAWRHAGIERNVDRHSLYLNATLKSPTFTNRSLFAAHREWVRRHVRRPRELREFVFPAWAPGERITIGYNCSYWDVDTITFQLLPMLRRHDRERFKVIAYAPTEPGPLARAAVDEIRIVGAMTNTDYVRQVRKDGVHLLVELNGYSIGHWFAAMASRCAPVQVSYLNYTSTCGVEEVDYVIADEIALPPEQDLFFTEQVYRVPGCFFCFTYEGTALPAVTPPPSEAAGRVTFGCFGSGGKINPPLLDLWAEILRRTPGSELFIRNNELTPADNRRAMVEAFVRRGIDPTRLRILPGTNRDGVLASYGEVDISLDTFPYCGGNTIAESLWQGVPVVTLKGDRFSAQYGASLLTGSGLAELVATTPEEYVQKAVALAGDRARLRRYRENLRTMVHTYGFSNAERFTRKMEAAFTEMVARAYAVAPGRAQAGEAPANAWVTDIARVLARTPAPAVIRSGEDGAIDAALPGARIHPDGPGLSFGSITADGPVTTLDAYCDSHGIDAVDLLAIDASGHELDVLRGARRLHERGGLRVVTFEFGEDHLETRTFLADFFDLLPDFAFFRQTGAGWQPLARRDRAAHEGFAAQRIVAMPEANREDLAALTRSPRD